MTMWTIWETIPCNSQKTITPMSKITQLNERSIGIEVKPDWTKFSIWVAQHSLRGHKKGFNYLQYFEGEHPIYDLIELPPGSWSILGKGNELTEEQWNGIVEQIVVMSGDDLIDGFKDYCDPVHGYVSPIPSGLSLLKSKGLNPETTLILQKQ